MIVGYAEVHLRIEGCHSLKDKRQVLHGTIEKVRRKLGVSIAEVGDQELWGNAVIGISCVSENSIQIEQILDRAIEFFDALPTASVDFIHRDIIRT